MKKLTSNKRLSVFAILTVMVAAFHLLFADPPAYCDVTCNTAAVYVGEDGVIDSKCCFEGVPTKVLAVICGRCGEAGGTASAHGQDLFETTIDGICSIDSASVEGNVEIKDPDGTGAQSKVEDLGDGNFSWRVWSPEPDGFKKSGAVQVIATVTADCEDCTGITGNKCDDCEIRTREYKAIGIVRINVPDDDDGGGCGSCGNQGPQQGTGNVSNRSVDFRLNLGRSTPKWDAGYISLYAEEPSADLAKPDSIKVPFVMPGVEVLPWTDETIKQVKTPQGLVHVAVKDDNNEYHLQCFYETNVVKDGNGAYVKDANGFYTTNADAAAYVTWIVKNPDGGQPYNRLWITEQRGESSRDFKYTYTSSTLRWDLLQPDGHTTISAWKTAVTPDGDTTNYFHQVTFDSTVVRKNQKTYKYVDTLGDKVLTQEVEGDGGLTRTTTYTYYSDSAGTGSANKLQRVDYPEGNWVYYKYNADGLMETEYSAYGNNAPPAPGDEPNLLTQTFRLKSYAYSLNFDDDGVVDDGGIKSEKPRRIITKIVSAGVSNEVSRIYHRFVSDANEETRQCPEPGGKWDDTGNLNTITEKDTSGRTTSVTHPDGTITSYHYDDEVTTRVRHLSPAGDGTESTTVVDELGLPLSITTKVVVGGTAGVKLAEQVYNYKDAYNNYLDHLRRSYDVTDLAQRKTQHRYNGCCGLDYMIDPDGVKTYYVQDPLLKWQLGTRRVVEVVQSTERVIETTNKLDAVGAVLATMRVGTNGTVITTAQFQYDVLGRVTRQTNALGGVTTNLYAIASSRLQEITLNPDGGTRTNTYYRDGRLESVTGTAVQGVRYVHNVEQDDSSIWREYTKEFKLYTNGVNTTEWTTNYVDGVGRSYKTVYAAGSAPYPYSQSWYNNLGQLEKQRDPDNVVTLYRYDAKGELIVSAIDVDQDDLIDDGQTGTDRVTRTTRTVLASTDAGNTRGVDITRTDIEVWTTDDSDAVAKVSTTETSTDGLKTWSTVYKDAANPATAVTTSTITQIATSGNGWTRTATATSPDGSSTVAVYKSGFLNTVTRFSSAPAQITKTTYGYDAHGRQNTMKDARNGTTTYTFNNADQTATVTTPIPGNGQAAQTTTTYYDTSLRATNVTQPDGTSVTSEFFPTGLLKKTYGSRTYPVEYFYDYAGRMKTMMTWQNFAGGTGAPTTTTWNYNQYRGWLEKKVYDGETDNTLDYEYLGSGRLWKRHWERGVTTTYAYNPAGDLQTVTYSNDPQSTPTVTYGYDRRGRKNTITQGSAVTTLTYNDANELLTETYTGGTLNGLSVTNGYDTYLRRTNLSTLNGSTLLTHATNSYDTASRLATVSDGTQTATYGYLANSLLVGTVTFKQNTTPRMTTTKSYDYLNRLSVIGSAPAASGQQPVSYSYQYNSANQRTRNTTADGSYWLYEYDSLGQVKRGAKYFNDGYPVPGQQFEYAHDDIGNRKSTKAGGDENGANLRVATYTPNNLNQYTSRTVPGAVDVMGIALATSTVEVNDPTPAAYRKGEYFRKQLTVANDTAPVWHQVDVTATGENPVTRHEFVPQTPEAFGYDLDGNLTSDGRWNYTWDGENRLTKVESLSSSPTASKRRVTWEYDGKGRRIRQTTYNGSSGSYVVTEDLKFVSDGWRCIAELNAADNALVSSYVWGLDLSSTLDGAGGVGGLLMLNSAANGAHFYAYDGNGNVVALVKASDGIVSALYEYDPFGTVLRSTGAMADENRFQFSTKRNDRTTDIELYEFRVRRPDLAWLSRDPIEEWGGLNLYEFVRNDPIYFVDLLGLQDKGPIPNPVIPPNWPAPGPGDPPLPPPKTPPPAPPGKPSSGSPKSPPTGTPSSPATGAGVDALNMCADMWNDIFNRWELQDGIKICRSQMKGWQSSERCCVMLFCKSQGCLSGRISIKRVMAYLDDQPCSAAQKEFETPGKVLKPGCPKGDKSVPAYEKMFLW